MARNWAVSRTQRRDSRSGVLPRRRAGGHRSADGTARIWDAQPDRDTLQLGRELSSVLDLTFSPDGRRVFIGSTEEEPASGTFRLARNLRLEGHTDWVPSVAFSPDGRKLASACFDRKARVWDAVTGREQTILEGHFDRLMQSPSPRTVGGSQPPVTMAP